jgi:phage terminase large subunit-like protein
VTDWTPEQIEAARAHLSPEEQAELDELLAGADLPPPSLLDFIPQVSPKFVSPRHLGPLVEELERARTEPVRFVSSTPPRHGKTELLLHYIAWLLKHDPAHQIAYVTHTGPLALMKSDKARKLAMAAGVPIARDSNAKSNWRTGEAEGGVWATSTGGAIVGLGFKTIIVDDPVKGRNDVESAVQRENDWNWFNGDLFNRLEPGGSIIVNMARWHEDDLSGRLVGEGWKNINLPALDDAGVPLWPERWTRKALDEIRAKSEYDWQSLYMGTPRTREGKLFEGAKTYERLPNTLNLAIGIDLAYSESTSADWSVAVVLGEHDGHWYLVKAIRRQVRADVFADDLLALQAEFPTATMRWYASGTEKGSADFMKARGVRLSVKPAANDKYIRAQPVAAAWKAGRVLLPAQPPPGMTPKELVEFRTVVTSFTGIGDVHDDDVDALAAAFDLLPSRIVPKEPPQGSPEWHRREAEKLLEHARKQAEMNRLARNGPGFIPNDPLLRGRR